MKKLFKIFISLLCKHPIKTNYEKCIARVFVEKNRKIKNKCFAKIEPNIFHFFLFELYNKPTVGMKVENNFTIEREKRFLDIYFETFLKSTCFCDFFSFINFVNTSKFALSRIYIGESHRVLQQDHFSCKKIKQSLIISHYFKIITIILTVST